MEQRSTSGFARFEDVNKITVGLGIGLLSCQKHLIYRN